MSNSIKPPARDFATTHWSVVQAAGRRSSPSSDEALASLCQTYWLPLYAFARRKVADVHEARDLTQAFFTELLEKNYLSDARQERGRFRAFLITAFRHFLSKEWDKARAQKRGGGKSPLALDFEAGDSRCWIEPGDNLTPERLYQRQWALTLLAKIIARLEEEYVRQGKGRHFERLKGFIIGDHAGTTYAAVAAELGVTEAAAKMTAHRMRNRYRELLREEIAQTVAGPEEIDDEIHDLFAALAK